MSRKSVHKDLKQNHSNAIVVMIAPRLIKVKLLPWSPSFKSWFNQNTGYAFLCTFAQGWVTVIASLTKSSVKASSLFFWELYTCRNDQCSNHLSLWIGTSCGLWLKTRKWRHKEYCERILWKKFAWAKTYHFRFKWNNSRSRNIIYLTASKSSI